ncbi:MAG: biotin transporter BioY [Halocynthiibacter sp.]
MTQRDIVLMSLFAALIAVLGLVPQIALATGVPITAQSLGIMLAGAVLGAKRGALSVLLFLALVALGLPLLAGGRGGIGVFAGPTVGFLVGFPIAAFVTGWIVEKYQTQYVAMDTTIAAVIGGMIVMYIPGVLGFAAVLDKSILDSMKILFVYLPGDLVKAIATGLITAALYKARPSSVLSRA